MRDREKELQAIERGKEWMKGSVNILHDYTHARNVANHSLKILKSFQKEGELTNLDKKIPLIAAWWHDCYKAQFADEGIKALLLEGIEAEKIMRRELNNLLSPDVLDTVGKMIRYHNLPAPIHFFYRKLYTPTFRLLYESDYIEGFNPERRKKSLKVFGFFARAFFKVYYVVYPLFMDLLPQTKYLKSLRRTFK